MSKEFEIHQDIDLPGTPEQVWKAVTDDTAAWMFPTGDWKAFVKVEEFPTHLVTRMEGPDGWFNQLEHQLTEGHQGTILRYVHSGIFVDDWDNQYDGASKHTAFYLHTLGQYLAHFNGRPVTFSDIQGPDAATAPNALDMFLTSLGLENAKEGESHSVNLPGSGLSEIVVDFRNENFVGLRTNSSMIRIFGRNAFGHRVGLTVHDFAPDADAQENTSLWQQAINEAYAQN
ncbi:ATPase [Arthrobacter sp. MYb227]|uniref:ATPase n=1 Tax=Arthrobacter sp. MYb227 TaxID=1848601 RepID=UPI000CFC5466|nr:ATPase [Arthrobacter sp. MYb227]PQZ96204.1 ATPase [Arthrobacter sp. MYb227]